MGYESFGKFLDNRPPPTIYALNQLQYRMGHTLLSAIVYEEENKDI